MGHRDPLSFAVGALIVGFAVCAVALLSGCGEREPALTGEPTAREIEDARRDLEESNSFERVAVVAGDGFAVAPTSTICPSPGAAVPMGGGASALLAVVAPDCREVSTTEPELAVVPGAQISISTGQAVAGVYVTARDGTRELAAIDAVPDDEDERRRWTATLPDSIEGATHLELSVSQLITDSANYAYRVRVAD